MSRLGQRAGLGDLLSIASYDASAPLAAPSYEPALYASAPAYDYEPPPDPVAAMIDAADAPVTEYVPDLEPSPAPEYAIAESYVPDPSGSDEPIDMVGAPAAGAPLMSFASSDPTEILDSAASMANALPSLLATSPAGELPGSALPPVSAPSIPGIPSGSKPAPPVLGSGSSSTSTSKPAIPPWALWLGGAAALVAVVVVVRKKRKKQG